jgi:hypothetical protein
MSEHRGSLQTATHHPSPITHHSVSFAALDALLLLVILNLALQPPLDPDFGWHLRTGLDLIHQGWRMPDLDPYSHTMPDWRWVEHAWLTDGLMALASGEPESGGCSAVILGFGVVTVAAWGVMVGGGGSSRTAQLLAVAGLLWVGLPFLGPRTQLVTMLGLAIAVRLCQGYLAGRRRQLWVLPPLFFLWANLHGGFTAGLFAVGVFLLASIGMRLALTRSPAWESRLHEPVLTWTSIGHVAAVLALCATATLFNPYGWRLHAEIVDSLSNTLMIEMLHEWQPVDLGTGAGRTFIGSLCVLGVLAAGCYRRIEPVRWSVLAVFLALSLRHWRNILFFLLLAAPLWAEVLATSAARVQAWIPGRRRRIVQFAVAMTVASVVGWLGPEHLERVIWAGTDTKQFFRTTDYPMEAVEWVQEHRSQLGSRPYNDYGFGGFLLWWLPGEKIFIDGRMPAWRIGDRWVFYDYLALTQEPPLLGVLAKYDVDWAIVVRDTPLNRALAKESAWAVAYQDVKVTIFVKR